MSNNDPKDRYGPPLEDPKLKRITGTEITGTSKQILHSLATKKSYYISLIFYLTKSFYTLTAKYSFLLPETSNAIIIAGWL